MDLFALTLIASAGMLGLVVAMQNWRIALLATVVIGFVQDPLRKVVPGEPVYLVGLCAGAMMLAMIGAGARHGMVSLRPLVAGDPRTRLVLSLFTFLVVLQAALCWVHFGSFPMALIGILSYLSPFPAIWLGYYFARDAADIRRLLLLYVVCAMLVTSGILLAWSGWDSPFLREVGEGLVLYDQELGRLRLISGFMRAPEVAAWHTGAATCLLIVLAVNFRSTLLRLMTPMAVMYLMTSGVLTGRRKMLVTVVMFGLSYLVLLFYYRQRSARRALVLILALSVAILAGALTLAPESSAYRPYVQRGQTVLGDVNERFTGMGIGSISWAMEYGGVFGIGAGAASQGSQHFVTEGLADVRAPAEGGLGKIVLELGLPGFLLALFAAGLIARNLRRVLDIAAMYDPELLKLSLGMVALLAANVPVFIGASQIYGDPFVLILLGSMLGFIFASPRIIQIRQQRAQASARAAHAGSSAYGLAVAR